MVVVVCECHSSPMMIMIMMKAVVAEDDVTCGSVVMGHENDVFDDLYDAS
jgi:hypothetical protein